MIKKHGLWSIGSLIGLCSGWGALPAQAEMIVAYDASNSPTGAAATEWLAGTTASALIRGSGLGAGTGATFNSSGWSDEPTDYLEWGWSSSVPLDLSDLDIRYDRSTSGPSVIGIQLSINGGGYTSIFSDASVNVNGEDNLDIDLSAFDRVTSASFRLFGSGASSGTGTLDIEPLTGISPDRGIVVNGTVAAVPEPGGFELAAVAFLGICGSRWWRRKCAANSTATSV